MPVRVVRAGSGGGGVKRKDVQRLALELVDAINEMRREMAAQDALVQWQVAEIAELKLRLRAAGDEVAL